MSFSEKVKPLEDIILPEAITSTRRICNILRPFINGQNLLRLTARNDDIAINATLLEIDTDNGVLVTYRQEPDTNGETSSLMNADGVTINLLDEGKTIRFDSRLLNYYHEKGITYYEFEFPENAEYCQRRNNDRYLANEANSIPIELYLYHNVDHPFIGVIYDISVNGLRICFPGNTDISLDGNKAHRCNINMPDGRLLKCQFRIRHTHHNKSSNQLYVGGYFINLDSKKKQIIEKLVMSLKNNS
jgi:c-di-GMP-binding flagellar brake protein YcgR